MIAETLTDLLAMTLLHFVWQGVAVAAALICLGGLLRLRQPSARYALYFAALALMGACPVVTFCWLGTGARFWVEPTPSAPLPPAAELAKAIEHGDGERAPMAIAIPRANFGTEESRRANWFDGHQRWIVFAWLVGVAVLGTRLLLGWTWLQRLQRQLETVPEKLTQDGLRLCRALGLKPCRIYGSRQIHEAIAAGLFRPIILIPVSWLTELPAEMLEAVLAHELAHLRRHDLWVNLLQRMTETLLFYHPAVWWVSRRLRTERELCCDDLAVTVTGNRLCYAQTLEQVGRLTLREKQPELTVAMGGSMSLLTRVQHVLGRQPASASSMPWLVGLAAVMVPALIAWWVFTAPTPTGEAAQTQSGEITGTVVDTKNQPVPSLKVLAYKNNQLIEQAIQTDAKGQFKVPGAWRDTSEAHHTLLVKDKDHVGWLDFAQCPSFKAEDTAFTIQLLPVDHRLAGQFTDPSGKPLADIPIAIEWLHHEKNCGMSPSRFGQGLFGVEIKTDEQGKFSLHVPAGCSGELQPRHADWAALRIRWKKDQQDLGSVKLIAGGRIEGTVLDATTGKPVAGASVGAQAYQPQIDTGGWGDAKSDADGRYVIGGLAPGTYNVLFSGFHENRKLTAVAVEGVEVLPNKPGKADFRVMEGRELSGKVIDGETGKPMAKIYVGYYGTARPRSGAACMMERTDEQGVFRFFVPPGVSFVYIASGDRKRLADSTCTLDLAADKVAPAVVLTAGPLYELPAQAKTFVVPAGAGDNAKVDDQAYVVKVSFRAAGDRPVAGVELRMVYSDGRNTAMWASHSGKTADVPVVQFGEGRKAFFLVDAHGFKPTQSPEFVVAKTIPPLSIDLEPAVAVQVQGRVLNVDGKPVPGARVRTGRTIWHQEEDFPWGVETVTDREGRYVLKHVGVGDRFFVRIDKPGTGGAESDRMTVAKAEPITLPDFRLGPPNLAIKGQVLSQDGKPVPDAKISYSGESKVETKSDAKGRFELGGLPAGKLPVKVSAAGFEDSGSVVRAGATNAKLYLYRPELPVDPALNVLLKLRPKDGKTVSATELWLVDVDSQSTLWGTEFNGNEYLSDRFRETRKNLAFVVFPAGYAHPVSIPFDLSKNLDPQVFDLEPAAAVKVRGRVLDAEGKPVAGAALKLFREIIVAGKTINLPFFQTNPGEAKAPMTDTEGRFEIGGLAPGTRIAVYANKSEFAGVRSAWSTLDKDKDAQLPVLVLKKSTRELTGVVVNTENKPVAGARVKIPDVAPVETTTDATGRFQLRAIPEGTVLLIVDSPDYEIAYESVPPGKTEVRIILERE
ncbi:MAG TPA: M56 family metallopeptidase [Gemmataceae bacterium]|nr:M56 family metallopeptidase [Gemmataceae bacterium]